MKASPENEKELLLDTHVLLWLLTGDIRLAKNMNVLKLIEKMALQRKVFCSAITFWEIAFLSSKKRIETHFSDSHFLEKIPSMTGIKILPLSIQILRNSCFLPGQFHKDPADRMIVATAIEHDLQLVTKDSQILAYSIGHNVETLEV